jgi:hypothetical protein
VPVLALASGWHFVFGGDSCDKGGAVGGSVRIVRALNQLKRRYPDRVTLLLGNRDINKMRMTSELAPSQLTRPLAEVPGAPWLPEGKRVTPLAFLRALVAKREGVEPAAVSDPQLAGANTLGNRLRWMLKETMGAPSAATASLPSPRAAQRASCPCAGSDGEFERRAAELALMSRSAAPPSDDEVGASFVASVRKGGFMRELLELGQLAAIINGTLYVHGGIARDGDDCLGAVPGQASGRHP